MKSNLLMARLVTPEPRQSSKLDPSKTLLLSSVLNSNAYDTLIFLAPQMVKNPSLGQLFERIEPDDNSQFTIEVGVELPDMLPNINDQADYAAEIDLDGDCRTLCVSNQMLRIDYLQQEKLRIAILPSCNRHLLDDEKIKIPNGPDTPVKHLKTMVSSRYVISGETAEAALESNIQRVIDSLLELVNKFLQSIQMLCSGNEYPALPSSYDQSSFDYLFLAIYGKDIRKNAFQRLALNFGKVSLNPKTLIESEATQLRAYLSAMLPFDDAHLMMNSAKSALDGGLLKMALLQMVIAAEIATNRTVKNLLLENGVSNTKLLKFEREMSYAQMLNISLISLLPKSHKLADDILGDLNRARDCRNKLMHEGVMVSDRAELLRLFQSTRKYLEHLKTCTQPEGNVATQRDESKNR